ncbi:MAG: tRNA glutamyl-Q(34) synthetase GluQRS [Paracoccaceae bacterium]|nr:tRNA glutamyl-Q(34) synthetase GluQRS [Paracoccaceae bacterium]
MYRTRFAPSPTGLLHLGHAYSAILAHDRATAAGGAFLLRIEDTDRARCRPAFEQAIYDDLHWLGLRWETPVLRQSDHLPDYEAALDRLIAMGLCYPCRCTRADIAAATAAPQEGAPHPPVYPGTCRARPMGDRQPGDAIRLDMARALARAGTALSFTETGPAHAGTHRLSEAHLLETAGDIVLSRKDIGPAYHLTVVVDDARQSITEVVRGEDLFDATPIHRLLQALLDLPTPTYHHNRLIRDATGKRLAKRDDARAISRYRAEGATPLDIRRIIGLA